LYNIAYVYGLTCNIVLPNNPFTSIGLSTPYIYNNCDQTIQEQASFAEAVILNKKTGELRIYTPLIINNGSQPLFDPVVPNITINDIVGIWFGSNSQTIVLDNPDPTCINGLPNDPFGQVAACNAINFFKTAYKMVSSNKLYIPDPGFNVYGKKCYTTRNFQVIDMDQSDNVLSEYIVYNNKVAQFSDSNILKLDPKYTKILKNGSDNRLLNIYILPALGCKSFMAPDISNNNTLRPAQVLNELQANIYTTHDIALIPLGNPMVLSNGVENMDKTNLFRSIVGQPLINNTMNASTSKYCEKIIKIGVPSLLLDQPFTLISNSPNENEKLFYFMMKRLQNSLQNLNCYKLLNITQRIWI
jgi:hypothetical protein